MEFCVVLVYLMIFLQCSLIHMFLIFSYGSSNIFPTGDLGFLKAISKLYKVKLPITEKILNSLYKKWSPYCSQATWYLWRSLDPIAVNY